MKKIAIQGVRGAFHETAARKYFNGKEIEIIPCDTFKDLFTSINNNTADYAIMAIENTVAGGIIPNYELLRTSGKQVFGEVYLTIRQNLMVLPGESIESITEVYSHPMALLQCKNFFEDKPNIKLIESIDTAFSAREIREKNLKNIGAIASVTAAEMYGLEIIAPSIETNKQNYTRFLLISEKQNKEFVDKTMNRSSICLSIKHQPGSLAKLLAVFSKFDINLTKIQSLPIIGSPWEYFFYIDLQFNNYTAYQYSLDEIKSYTTYLKLLGEYKEGEKYEN